MNEGKLKTIRDRLFSPSTSDGNVHNSELSAHEVIDQLKQNEKYRHLKFLGKGGMGVINLAQDKNCLRKVAIKSLNKSHKEDNEAILRFTEEAQIAAQLEHPNIVPIYDLGLNEESMPYYAMKLIHGKNLSQIIHGIKNGNDKYVKKFTVSELLNIIMKVCDAMHSACSKGVLHRDLKPENIMIGEYGEVTIVDWGLAKVVVPGEISQTKKLENVLKNLPVESIRSKNNVNLSMNNVLIGTPAFMAPERVLGEDSEQGEVYAIGAILYLVFTLELLYQDSDMHSMLKKVCSGKYTPLSSFSNLPHMPGGRIPTSLAAVVDKAIHIDREKRYKQVIEIRKDLEAYLNGYATGAEDAGVFTLIFLNLKRNKKLLAFISFLTAIIIFMVTWSIIKVRASELRASHESTMALILEKEAKKKSKEAKDKTLELESKVEELILSAPVLIENAIHHVENFKFKEAMNNIQNAITLKNDQAQYYEFKAYLHLVEMEFQKAMLAFRKAGKISKNLYLDEISLCRSLFNSVDSKDHNKKLLELFKFFDRKEKFPQAISILNRLPNSGERDNYLKATWIKNLEGTAIANYFNKNRWDEFHVSRGKLSIIMF